MSDQLSGRSYQEMPDGRVYVTEWRTLDLTIEAIDADGNVLPDGHPPLHDPVVPWRWWQWLLYSSPLWAWLPIGLIVSWLIRS